LGVTDHPGAGDRGSALSVDDPVLARLAEAIDGAGRLLPAQGPITVFIHHNTLHAFEDRPFTAAVEAAGRLFGCQPYMAKRQYREALARGRIQFADLEAVLREDLGPRVDVKVLRSCARLDLRLAMLQYPLRHGPTAELAWFLAETDALRRVRSDVSAAVRGRLIAETRHWAMRDLRGGDEPPPPLFPSPLGGRGKEIPPEAGGSLTGLAALRNQLADLFGRSGAAHVEDWPESAWEAFTLQALWRVCRAGVASVPELTPPPPPPVRHRDLLLRVAGVDTDLSVHELLVRFCGAFLDQGLAHQQLPGREHGFYRSFIALYRQLAGPPDRWLRGLRAELRRLDENGITPLASIRESLELLGVPEAEWDAFASGTLLALRGWAGMTRFLEERPERAVRPILSGSLTEFLAVRLMLDRLALAAAARDAIGYAGSLAGLRAELRRRIESPPPGIEQRAIPVFQLAQILGWTPEALHELDPVDWYRLVAEVESFSPVERHRVFHLAYERRFYTRALDALALHNRVAARPRRRAGSFQAIFCIDEREESLRRHVEEVCPAAETYGIAGFYFVDMYYRGAGDAHYTPLCPAVIRPEHWVVEQVVDSEAAERELRARARRALGLARRRFHVGSRTFAVGAVLSGAVGVLASVPLVARTLFPRLTARFRTAAARIVRVPPRTRLQLERADPTAGPDGGGIGFTVDEMVAIAERVLRDTGLTADFARLVFAFGHGSTSMNNPHESAHDCGACGGGRGGPNGRAIAQMLNDPRVRAGLAERGITVPPDTVFVGGMHNTSSDALSFYDTDLIPASHRDEFEAARAAVEVACERDAHERCRRFRSAPLSLSAPAARQHVEGRAEDLAQVRPEWGHATNALTVIGRRARTRGLFLDRRAFLNSYDPTQDDADGTILARVLRAAVPVCAGISLEYYFSFVDNAGYGSGTKLPHNIAGLHGVMDGAGSDLRTGLPWQMVEIHEPVRHLFVIETTPDALTRVLDRTPEVQRLVRNEWVRLATLDPRSPAIHVWRAGAFHLYEPQADRLPRAASSADWYRGWRDHLEFARIG
jgi:uncharacterized protein YbcC (UPF0753/DUF2309 family)